MNGLASTKMRPTFLNKNLASPQTEIIIQSYGIISEKWKTTYKNGKKNARNEMLTKLTQQQGCEGNRQRQTQNKRPNE